MAEGDIGFLASNNTDCTIEDAAGVQQRATLSASIVESGFREGLTGYAATISSDHAYIHQGKAYTAIIGTGSISAPYYIGFRTPATDKYIHWRPIGLTSSADYVEFVLYEGDTFSGGTAVTPRNRNRNFPDSSVMQTFSQGVTSTPAGIIIDADGVGTSGIPSAISGGGSGANEELLLKPDTDYVLQVDPDGATLCVLKLFWYEEDGFAP